MVTPVMKSISARLATVLFSLSLLCGVVPAQENGGSPPESIDRLVTVTDLKENQIEKINAFATYWSQRLSNDSPQTVQEARDQLIRPLRNVSGRQANLMFRTTYGDALIPELTKVIDGSVRYQAINAIQVAALLHTPASLALLESHIESDNEARPDIRLWSVIGVGQAIGVDSIRADKIKGGLRALARGGENETNPLVLRRIFEVLDEAVRNQRPNNLGGDEIRNLAIESEVDLVKQTFQRLQDQDAPADLLLALEPGIILIRNQYIDPRLQQVSRRTSNGMSEKVATYIGRRNAPQLGQIYDVILLNQDRIREDPELNRAAGQLIDSSETTMKLVHSNLQSGTSPTGLTDGKALWTNQDLVGLARNRDAWMTVLAEQPYQR